MSGGPCSLPLFLSGADKRQTDIINPPSEGQIE